MKWFVNSSIFLSGVVLFILCDLAMAGCEKNELYEKEIKNIHSATTVKAGSVFFVNVFGGFLPIPSRYVVYPATDFKKIILDSSVSPGKGNFYLGCRNFPEIIGHIEIDDIKKCLFCDLIAKEIKKDLDIVREEKMYGVNVRILRSKNPSPGEGEMIVMYDKKHYVTMVDDNKKLWRTILGNKK